MYHRMPAAEAEDIQQFSFGFQQLKPEDIHSEENNPYYDYEIENKRLPTLNDSLEETQFAAVGAQTNRNELWRQTAHSECDVRSTG